MAGIAGPERDATWVVPRSIDQDVEALGRQRVRQALRPFHQRDPFGLAVVDETAGQRLGRAGKPVQVHVEEWQPAPILGHQHEARRHDRVRDPQPGTETLGELRLARAEIADQADQVARPGGGGQGGPKGAGIRSVSSDDDPFGAGPGYHQRRLPETRPTPLRTVAFLQRQVRRGAAMQWSGTATLDRRRQPIGQITPTAAPI